MVLGTKIWALLAGGVEPCGSWQACADLAPGALRRPPPPCTCADVSDLDPGLLVILG